jgi:HTH-type transcriptional regulator/antitoxin HipB
MTPEELGTTVRQTRKQQGLRQDQLAAAANVGVRFIIDLEAGKPTAQMGKTLAVVRALGLTLTITDPNASSYS